MTSHELAHKLLTMPDVMVTVSGYEGGVHEINAVQEPRELCQNVNTAWYYGPHEYYDGDRDWSSEMTDMKDRPTIQAIHIG